ncbi:MAG: hypothetical protein DSY42_03575 [Aquifex sp.]|nr:MAG: hypothetical protein DSY42_03575 [Aquifex sp.]
MDWEDYKKDLENTEWNMVSGVDEANDMLSKRVNEVAESRIGKTKQGKKRKLCNRWWNKEIEKARKERREYNRTCRRLRMKKHNSDAERLEFEEAWEKYRKKTEGGEKTD